MVNQATNKTWDSTAPKLLFLCFVLLTALEVFFTASGGSTLDWNDWLFWAKQNVEQLSESGSCCRLVLSPVQSLYGLSYPLNPFFNPLWLLATMVSDPIAAHRVTSVAVLVLFAWVVWLLCARFIVSKWIILVVSLICLNTFFRETLPLDFLFPATSFSYFRLMPPQNLLFIAALFVYLIATSEGNRLVRILSTAGVVAAGVLADPLYSFIYFGPVLALVFMTLVAQLKERWSELLGYVVIAALVYWTGYLDYPFALKDSIARSFFSEQLFHHVKTLRNSSFLFQYPQNFLFSICVGLTTFVLVWERQTRAQVGPVAILQILFALIGALYLVSNINLHMIPSLHIIEGPMLPFYCAVLGKGVEELSKGRLDWKSKNVRAMFLGMFVVLLGAKSLSAPLRQELAVERYTGVETVLGEVIGSASENIGAVSFTFGSKFNERNGLDDVFGIEMAEFHQNNEGGGFFEKYGRSTSILSYWAQGQPTLEENNHLTGPFFQYFFRNLFMRPFDYYGTNGNFFTLPQRHLYPMLGVGLLLTDDPDGQGEELILGDDSFFVERYSRINNGQYSPTVLQVYSAGVEATTALASSNFNPELVVLIDIKDNALLEIPEVVPSSAASFSYAENGIAFKGNSKGTSISLLPVRFSRCLKSSRKLQLFRANLLLTGVIFSGNVEERIEFLGPPFDNSCLREDHRDARRLLREGPAQRFPYHYMDNEELLSEYWEDLVVYMKSLITGEHFRTVLRSRREGLAREKL